MTDKADVEIVRSLNPSRLTMLSEEQAAAQDGLLLNHAYNDLRGFDLTDLREVLAEEKDFLERVGTCEPGSDEMTELLDEHFIEAEFGLDLGVGAAVVALSVMGAAPISSCNGGVFGDEHASSVPHILFSIDPSAVPPIELAAEAAGCGLINNGPYAELYAARPRDLHRFAELIEKRQAALAG